MAESDPDLLRVLIIDPDTVRRGMLACSLPSAQFSLEFARTPEKGIELLAASAPEVVIVGHDRSAAELCHRLRALPSGARCALLLMDEQFRDEALGAAEAEAAGADAFLPFPFEVGALEQKLRDCPRSRRGLPRVEPSAPEAPPAAPTADLPEDAARPPVAFGWDEFRGQVQRLRAELDTLDYYQLLKVPAGASLAEVKEAYFRSSVELHPDRFMQLPDDELRADIYEVYKRISEAFKILINPETRARYDAMLSGVDGPRALRYLEHTRPPLSDLEDPTADASTPAAKRYLHYANLAEAEGNLRSARMYLTLALQCEPHSTPLRSRLDAVTRRLG